MPSPAQHYAKAEELIGRASECVVPSITRSLVDQAQVHATLATCVAWEEYDEPTWAPSRGMVNADVKGDRL